MNAENKCPHCGAGLMIERHDDWYDCGYDDRGTRTYECYQRELRKRRPLKEQVRLLKTALEATEKRREDEWYLNNSAEARADSALGNLRRAVDDAHDLLKVTCGNECNTDEWNTAAEKWCSRHSCRRAFFNWEEDDNHG